MSSVTINLDEVVGEDLEFVLNGEAYFLPPDVPTENMVRLMRVWGNAQTLPDESEEQAEALRLVYTRILELFQIRQPDLQSSFDLSKRVDDGEITAQERADIPELTIGMRQIAVVMGAIDTAYNATETGDGESVPLDRPKKSGSSNGSSRSKKPSAGVRKTGARSAGAS